MDDTAEILLIEDNPADERIVMEAFRETDWVKHTTVVTSGQQALDFLRHEGEFLSAPRPDLIVMDLNLPDTSGQDLLAELKVDAKLKRIPVVVLTGSESGLDVSNCYKLGADCYLTKPSRFEGFVSLTKKMKECWETAVRGAPDVSRYLRRATEGKAFQITRSESFTLVWLVIILAVILFVTLCRF